MATPKKTAALVNEPTPAATRPAPWADDVLNRKAHADFLTGYLSNRTASPNRAGSFTVALDSSWGTGKTYFVQNWSRSLDESKPRRITFLFDAWAADYAADPMLAFMSAFKDALDAEIGRHPIALKARKLLTSKVNDAVKAVRRAMWPVAKVVGKALLHKATGIAAEQAWAEITDEPEESPTADLDISELGSETIEKALDEFFKKSMESHEERAVSIASFRAIVQETLQELSKDGSVAGPMFVFVDELDRCRPSFAISLLEGIKHLFGIAGVCFVISTNMRQLSESVKAVYGSGFDGYGYLKRFFDVQVGLPEPNGPHFAKSIFAEFKGAVPNTPSLGLPKNGFIGWDKSPETVLFWIAQTMQLDLRAQRQVMEMYTAAASGISSGRRVHTLWLLLLCAIKLKSSKAFEEFTRIPAGDAGAIGKAFSEVGYQDVVRQYQRPGAPGTDPINVTLREVAAFYMHLTKDDLEVTKQAALNVNASDYPRGLIHEIAEELPSNYYSAMAYPSSLANYFELVRTAGHVTASQQDQKI